MTASLWEESGSLDILFISYREGNADKNWLDLKRRFPRAKRVHGVKGIREAHRKAAEKSETPFFFVVDGDNRILPEFKFEAPQEKLDPDAVYVYRCRNPINELVYGYGAVKIYSKKLLLSDQNLNYQDFATQIARKYKIIHEIASESFYFSNPEEAWRGAFRECFKLARQSLEGRGDQRSEERLSVWCEKRKPYRYSEWVVLGAKQGREIARSQSWEYCQINDFDWLKRYFDGNAKIRNI